MIKTENSAFQPNWVSPPGETITDILEEQNISSAEFAQLMGCTKDQAKDLLQGKTLITIEMARKLERILGASTAFWMVRESQYRADLVRLKGEALQSDDSDWLKELPLNDMIKFGWIDKKATQAAQLRECLKFFATETVQNWRDLNFESRKEYAFRTSSSLNSNPSSVAAWLRQGEIKASSIACKSWNPELFREVLVANRALTKKKDPEHFIPQLVESCAECGVAVVIVRAPSGCRASGATRFLTSNKALLLLSFRYLSDDHFWFTFFHEAGHLLLHGKKEVFIEGVDTSRNRKEDEANEFSENMLIPQKFRSAFENLPCNGKEVIRFSRIIGISPGIVVGQLQHAGYLKQGHLSNLKRRFRWK